MTGASYQVDGMPKVTNWAPPPKNLGESLADEIYRICVNRGMDAPIVLDDMEKTLMVRSVKAWQAAWDE